MFPSSLPYCVATLTVLSSQEEIVRSAAWRYISDAITKEEALAMLKEKEAGKKEREENVKKVGCVDSFIPHPSPMLTFLLLRYPAYVTSAGWLGYSDEKVARLTREAVEQGFSHFKMKVGANQANDIKRGKIIRSIIDDPQYLPERHKSTLFFLLSILKHSLIAA